MIDNLSFEPVDIQIWNRIEDRVLAQVYDRVRGQVWNQVSSQGCNQIYGQIRGQVNQVNYD